LIVIRCSIRAIRARHDAVEEPSKLILGGPLAEALKHRRSERLAGRIGSCRRVHAITAAQSGVGGSRDAAGALSEWRS
jgi:hypothetical protein